MNFSRRYLPTSLLIAAAAGPGAMGAYAQVTGDAAPADLGRVEVTGSAIKRIDAESAVPVTVIKADDLKKNGVTTVEDVLSFISASQSSTGTSQVVGAGTGGASFADLRGIGRNKTLVLLNGRRLTNNAIDGSAPDLNVIPFAAIQRVEVLRDGASALYGTDAIGGVINFITRTDFRGGTITVGTDLPTKSGGKRYNANAGFGIGDLATDPFNVYGFVDYQKEDSVNGTQRNYNRRYNGGVSTSTFPANYFQGGASGNPNAPGCDATNLFSDGKTGCRISTSPFVDYVPKSERYSGLLRGTLKINEDNRVSLEYFAAQSKVSAFIAPVPYGNLYMNRLLPSGALNPYYPGNVPGTSPVPNIALSPTYTEADPKDPTSPVCSYPYATGACAPGFIHVKFRDLPNGRREGLDTNTEQRLVAALEGNLANWDYRLGIHWGRNQVNDNIAGYSNGPVISDGVLNGIINPFGDQSTAGAALLASAGVAGRLQDADGSLSGVDFNASREIGDWFKTGHAVAIAIGGEYRHERLTDTGNAGTDANPGTATLVTASTGFDPSTNNVGSRSIYAVYGELDVPLLSTLDITGAVRYDKYSDFGNTTNPKVSFRWQPAQSLLFRGSYSTGFRAPSLYDLNASQTYTNTASPFDDPVNCPNGNPIPGKSSSANCAQQFQTLVGGNLKLAPEKSKNATLGFVVEPVANTSIGLDFWWVFVKQQIGGLTDDTVFGDPALYASTFHRNARGDLAIDGSQCPNPTTCGYVDLRNQNLGGVYTNGIDITGSYRLQTAGLGTYNFGFQSTYVSKYDYQTAAGSDWTHNVGIFNGSSPVFRWQTTATVAWNMGPVSAGLTGHLKSSYIDQDPTYTVGGYQTVDAFGSWAPLKGTLLTLGVRNVFDRAPPLSFQTETFQAGYDPRYTDPTGRLFYLRGTYSF